MDQRIVRHALVDSTSERAFAELAAGRARHGDVHVAEGQTRGRGRLGRPWHSARGEGLYASVVLLPPRPWPAAALTMTLGLAVLDAVRVLGLTRARLDWPNDVVVDGAKLAGVLVETRDLDARCPAYVVGIGINVAQRGFPAELTAERAVTSLAQQGLEASTEEVLRALLAALGQRLASLAKAPGSIEHEYVQAAGLDCGPILVETAKGNITGQLESWSAEGGAVLRRPDDALERVALEHIRGCRPVAAREPERAD